MKIFADAGTVYAPLMERLREYLLCLWSLRA